MANRKTHEDVMELLDQVPGVKEHLRKYSVQAGAGILKLRIKKGLTHVELVEFLERKGVFVIEAELEAMEVGSETVPDSLYRDVLSALI